MSDSVIEVISEAITKCHNHKQLVKVVEIIKTSNIAESQLPTIREVYLTQKRYLNSLLCIKCKGTGKYGETGKCYACNGTGYINKGVK